MLCVSLFAPEELVLRHSFLAGRHLSLQLLIWLLGGFVIVCFILINLLPEKEPPSVQLFHGRSLLLPGQH